MNLVCSATEEEEADISYMACELFREGLEVGHDAALLRRSRFLGGMYSTIPVYGTRRFLPDP